MRQLLTAAALILAFPAHALDVVVGAGTAYFNFPSDRDDAIFIGEVHSAPLTTWGRADISVAGAAVGHANGTYWVGAGVSAIAPIGKGWFVEGSFMPGYYEAFDSIDDIGADLEFRTLIGIGREVAEDTRLSVAISHKSNADTGRFNPGVDAISLRLRRAMR